MENAIQSEFMSAIDVVELAAGGRVWARLPEGTAFYRATATIVDGLHDRPMVRIDAGWGACKVELRDVIEVDTGRIA